MSRRDYAHSEIYSEHERDHQGSRRSRGGGRTAELEEVEIRERRRAPAAVPEFLREDYGRGSQAGALVVKERERSVERPRRRGREIEEKEEIIIREKSRERPRRREVVEEDVVIDRGPRRKEVVEEEVVVDRGPRRREVVEEEVIVDRGPRRRDDIREEIVYRERERSPPRPTRTEREEFEFYRREERERERDPIPYRDPAPMPPLAPVRSEREVFEYRPIIREPTPEPREERTEITIKEKSRERPRYREEKDEEIIIRERSRERPRYREERDEEIIIRDREREKPRYRDENREEIIIRRDERSREPPRYRDERDEEIIIRDRERERPRYRDEREEEIIIRDRERERPRYREERDEEREIIIREKEREKYRPREVERDSLTIRTEDRTRAKSRGGFEESDALVIRREEGRSRAPSIAPSRGDYREEDITIRERDRERYRERSRSRDREDIIFRHDDRGGRHNDEIIIRRNERSPSPELPPPAPPEPVRAPPIVQEVITHHRHIEHGFERAPEPPRPPPRSPSPEREERIEIRHRGSVNGRRYDDDIIFERESGGRRPLEGVHRGHTEDEFALVRRSERENAVGPPVRYEAREERKDRLWTEITKDLVSEEAIRERGFEFEEAETSWFVMQHLRYDDVLGLVNLTEDIRADRRDRISEIQAERERGPPHFRRGIPPPPGPWDEERIVEREIIYDGPGRPPRRIR